MSEDKLMTLPDGRELFFRDTGTGAPLLMVMGLGMQLIEWPPEFIAALVDRGFRVITFDNRDVGRSSRIDVPPPSTLRLLSRRARPMDYDLVDMSQDGIALINQLGIERTHVLGMSMGGMIAQTMAARFPDRVASLTSIFSNTGARRTGQPTARVMAHLARRPPRTRDAAGVERLRIMRLIGGRGPYAIDEAATVAAAKRAWDRALPNPHEGVARQMMAILKSGDRTDELARVSAPTQVIHGDRDAIVAPSGGRATAAAIKGAKLEVIENMGHEIAVPLVPRIVELTARIAGQASRA